MSNTEAEALTAYQQIARQPQVLHALVNSKPYNHQQAQALHRAVTELQGLRSATRDVTDVVEAYKTGQATAEQAMQELTQMLA